MLASLILKNAHVVIGLRRDITTSVMPVTSKIGFKAFSSLLWSSYLYLSQ